MAETYYYCDGETKKSTSVSVSFGTTQFREYNIFENTKVGEYYQVATFSLSPAPTAPVQVRLTFEVRITYDGGTPSTWSPSNKYILIPAGSSSHQEEVRISYEVCANSGEGDVVGDVEL